jgi:WD40 repeat protein
MTVYERGVVLWRADHTDDGVDDLAWSPDGERIAFVGVNHAMSPEGIAPAVGLYLLDAESGKPLRDFAYGDGCRSVAFAADGALAITTPDEVQIIPAKRSAPSVRVKSADPSAARFSPDGARIAWLAAGGTAIARYDLGAHVALPPIQLRGAANALAIAPDGALIAVAGGSGVQLYDAASGALVRTLAQAAVDAAGVLFSPDGARVTATWQGRQPRTWRVGGDGEEIATEGHGAPVTSADCSGDAIATAGADGTVYVWSFDGTPRVELPRQPAVGRVRFSRDGARLVTATDSADATVWNPRPARGSRRSRTP